MKTFLDDDFLLTNDTARILFHNYAKKMPIIDYHCHINPKEIAEDRRFENITQLWLGGDHYKWRLMRANGVAEAYITGDAPDKEKFMKWADTLSKCIGNPIYHWSHLELQRYFGYYGTLNRQTAEEVWDLCNARLANPYMSARNIIKNSNVTHLCTTDDPVDSLIWHEKIKNDASFNVVVLPTWRPDKAMNLEKDDYLQYIGTLSNVSGIAIESFDTLMEALNKRILYFHDRGCRLSDHGLDYIFYAPASLQTVRNIFKKRLSGHMPTAEEAQQFKTAFLLEMGKAYTRLGWAMQLHYGCKRNTNTKAYKELGPDTGFDCMDNSSTAAQLADLLDALNNNKSLPKTIIYSLNPNDNSYIDSVIGCFQDDSCICKLQHGSAWWFNDHKAGMLDHMTTLANMGLLSGFVGMLTDSRSFISYTRHEYFRRILCDMIGNWVENGEYPADYTALGELVENISYNNALRYFNFNRLI